MKHLFSRLAGRLRTGVKEPVICIPSTVPTNLAGLTSKTISDTLDQIYAYGLPHLIPDGLVWTMKIGRPTDPITITAGIIPNQPLLIVGSVTEQCQIIQLLNGALVWNPEIKLQQLLDAVAYTDCYMAMIGFLDEVASHRLGILDGELSIPNEAIFLDATDHYCFEREVDALQLIEIFAKPSDLICVKVHLGFMVCRVQDVEFIIVTYGAPSDDNDRAIRERMAEWTRRTLANQNEPRRFS